jgi:large subunit ribosomal protein L3
MVNGLMGKKLGMTRVFREAGQWVPVTVIEAGPCTVVQVRTADKDGYGAAQLGFGERKESRCTKPLKGHFDKAGVAPRRWLREFRIAGDGELNPGDEIKVDLFEVGEKVHVTGTSKGKGFQGVMKRHGFGGGPGGHGSHAHREPGSVGMAADPARVLKGKKLPGQMGRERVTVRNLEVVSVDAEKNLVLVRGNVPGPNGGLVLLTKSQQGAS